MGVNWAYVTPSTVSSGKYPRIVARKIFPKMFKLVLKKITWLNVVPVFESNDLLNKIYFTKMKNQSCQKSSKTMNRKVFQLDFWHFYFFISTQDKYLMTKSSFIRIITGMNMIKVHFKAWVFGNQGVNVEALKL